MVAVILQREERRKVEIFGKEGVEIYYSFVPKKTREKVGVHLDEAWEYNSLGGCELAGEKLYPIYRDYTYWEDGCEVSYFAKRGGGYGPIHICSEKADSPKDYAPGAWGIYAKNAVAGMPSGQAVCHLRHNWTSYHYWLDSGMPYMEAFKKANQLIKERFPEYGEECDRQIDRKKSESAQSLAAIV